MSRPGMLACASTRAQMRGRADAPKALAADAGAGRRSKYAPHQGKRERARRVRQAARLAEVQP